MRWHVKIIIELDGKPDSLKTLLLQVSQYVCDPAVKQLGISLDVKNAAVIGRVTIEPESQQDADLQEKAVLFLRSAYLSYETEHPEVWKLCAAANFAMETGLDIRFCKQLMDELLDKTVFYANSTT